VLLPAASLVAACVLWFAGLPHCTRTIRSNDCQMLPLCCCLLSATEPRVQWLAGHTNTRPNPPYTCNSHASVSLSAAEHDRAACAVAGGAAARAGAQCLCSCLHAFVCRSNSTARYCMLVLWQSIPTSGQHPLTYATCTHLSPFLLQSTTEPRVQWLEEQLRDLGLSDGPAATGLVLGSLCLGQFSLDNNWCVEHRETERLLRPTFGVALQRSCEQCPVC
jgi:hypothetical protein